LKEVWQKHSGKAMRTNSSSKALLVASRKIYCCSSLFNRRSGDTRCPEVRSRHMEGFRPCVCRAVQLAEIRPKTAASLEDLSGRVEARFPPTRRGSVRPPIVQQFWLKYSRYKDGTM
jgi:hypothetical protein